MTGITFWSSLGDRPHMYHSAQTQTSKQETLNERVWSNLFSFLISINSIFFWIPKRRIMWIKWSKGLATLTPSYLSHFKILIISTSMSFFVPFFYHSHKPSKTNIILPFLQEVFFLLPIARAEKASHENQFVNKLTARQSSLSRLKVCPKEHRPPRIER